MSLLGIDAGATWIKAGRFSAQDLTLEKSVQAPSGAARGVEAYFDSIAVAAEQLGKAEVIGLALPGTLSRDGGTLKYAANIKGLSVEDAAPVVIAQAVSDRLATERIIANNDAKCAALAEWQYGIGQGKKSTSLLHLTWGTGIGTALVIKGKLQYGWEGGHLPVTWEEEAARPCQCGSKRDLEAFCSVPHLAAQSGLPPEALVEAARSGEEISRKVMSDAVAWLARGLHMMSVLVYPDVVTVGGGFMATDWLLEKVREEVGREANGYLGDTLRPDMVHRARLGNNAGMIGAAMLARGKFTRRT